MGVRAIQVSALGRYTAGRWALARWRRTPKTANKTENNAVNVCCVKKSSCVTAAGGSRTWKHPESWILDPGRWIFESFGRRESPSTTNHQARTYRLPRTAHILRSIYMCMLHACMMYVVGYHAATRGTMWKVVLNGKATSKPTFSVEMLQPGSLLKYTR